MNILKSIVVFAKLVKIEHSLFALPFAFTGAFIAASGKPQWRDMLWLTLAMICIRSFAMAFNRLADLKYDTLNPRTQNRPLVAGDITRTQTAVLIALCGALFVAASAMINATCLKLAPIALALSAFYSYTKRFTWLCHFVLGAVIGLAPVAGWLAGAPGFSVTPLLLFLGVLFWTAGFDVLYASQDEAFDREHNLNSVPVRFGVPTAFTIAGFCHVNAAIFYLLAGLTAWIPWPYYAAWALASLVLLIEHRIISPTKLDRISLAFFTLNAVVAMILFFGVLAAFLIPGV